MSLDLRCRCESFSLNGYRARTTTHVRYDGVSSEGALRFIVECPDPATQEDGLCDRCRAGHPQHQGVAP